ncbi:MAG: Gfo/Idh/MocA family oxidoreductase [Caldilineaceae bacterium SB0662_bin_9]|uniref:Gfo/Idh/MocA family oxidoreductase n=1 Tax=Caldilineaceae bacterium SB0662_bin_9 TaxID=2605258 RepID=A0A6B1DST9_9CHLR|nr:Gfo/Idh/MocA family oxidoreductase [Caldilineaceae bacterium SB0662_bin_9]
MSDRRTRYALVGTGGRGMMYVDAIHGAFRDHAELVGICDLSPTRMQVYNDAIADRWDGAPVPAYTDNRFDAMVAETKPDTVVVTTMDSTHHQYIIRAMELGCDAISEKPMTTDAEKAQAIVDAINRTGRKLRVTFNYRYAPMATRIRELVMDGAVGKPLHVDFSWVLDTSHGADYFRRWHREKDKSGGLLVHKATHHFDLVNWWIASFPDEVYAMGRLGFYGRENALARGEAYSYDRYTGSEAAEEDPFALRLDQDERLKRLYMDAEEDSGYVRDRNVFGDGISAEDVMSVTARYRNGVLLTYSLLAFCPWEGYRVAITGDRGRVEMDVCETIGRTFIQGAEETTAQMEQARSDFAVREIRHYPMFGIPRQIDWVEGEGGHGGGDPVMLEQIFHPDPPDDPFHRSASHVDGAASILLGIAANQSIATGRAVRTAALGNV